MTEPICLACIRDAAPEWHADWCDLSTESQESPQDDAEALWCAIRDYEATRAVAAAMLRSGDVR